MGVAPVLFDLLFRNHPIFPRLPRRVAPVMPLRWNWDGTWDWTKHQKKKVAFFPSPNHQKQPKFHDEPAKMGNDTSIPIGYMVLVYIVTWIPSIYPLYVSIYIPAPWIRHGILRIFGPFFPPETKDCSRTNTTGNPPRNSDDSAFEQHVSPAKMTVATWRCHQQAQGWLAERKWWFD